MKFRHLLTLAFLAVLAAGCGSDSTSSRTPEGSGQATFYLTDGPVDLTDINNLFITFDRLFVFPEPDSIPPDTTGNLVRRVEILTTPVTFDMLSLTNGLAEALGTINLPAGDYRALWLDLVREGAWLIEADGDTHDVWVPSGRLFIPVDFTVEEGQNTDIVLDFDAAASLHLIETGSGRYILRPVVRQLPNAVESATVEGTVFVETPQGLKPAGDVLVPNPRLGRPGQDRGNGNRPGDKHGRGRPPVDERAMVPLTVAWPMLVHAALHDTTPEDSTDDAGARLNPLDDDNGNGEDARFRNIHRPHPRGTVVGPEGNYVLWRLRLDGEYDLRLRIHPRSGFEVVSGPGTILLDDDLTGQDFVIRPVAAPPAP